MIEQISKANHFIEENKGKINTQYRNHYHVMAPIGWINDPNGFVYFNNEYHLFFQYYPYDSVWGPMHWGHVKSKNLVDWEDMPVMLAPSEAYDENGCFSGSAIEKDGKLFLFYTGHVENDVEKREVQCFAISEDGITAKKYEKNPIIDEKQLQNVASIDDFRDPKVFEKNGLYYMVVATKTDNHHGQILLFKSENLYDWTFFSVLLEGNAHQGVMWECPDLFELDGKDVLIMSPIKMEKQADAYANTSSTVAFIGQVDWQTGKFQVENYHEIDGGLDFYAPQTCEDDQGNRFLIAWMQMWDRNMPTNDLGHGWAGSMTLPRLLHVKNNYLVQEPTPFIYEGITEDYVAQDMMLEDEYVLQNKVTDAQYLKFVVDMTDAEKFMLHYGKNQTQYFEISYERENSLLTASREKMGYSIVGAEQPSLVERSMAIPLVDNVLTLEIFRDTSSLEIFINQEKTMSFTFYEKDKGKDIVMKAVGTAKMKEIKIGTI